MKVIITGCTGYIGGGVLTECIANPQITSILALSRRDLPVSDPKLKVVVMKDFNSYSEETLNELEGADACIWCMGTYNADYKVEVEYPVAFANAFATTLRKNNDNSHKFRYVHLGGALTERDQDKTLWFMPSARKVRGQAEEKMEKFPIEKEITDKWETYIVKPGWIRAKDGFAVNFTSFLLGVSNTIRLDVLSKSMISISLNGFVDRIVSTKLLNDMATK